MKKIEQLMKRLRRKPVELEKSLWDLVTKSKDSVEKFEGLVALARVALSRGEGPKAVQLLTRATSMMPSRREELVLEFGLAFYASGATGQAMSHIRRAVIRDPENATALVAFAKLTPHDSERWMEKAATAWTATASAHVELGLWHLRRGEGELARKRFEKALEDPGLVAESTETVARAGLAACGAGEELTALLKLNLRDVDPLVYELILQGMRAANLPRREALAVGVARWPERTDLRVEWAETLEPELGEKEFRALLAQETRRDVQVAILARLAVYLAQHGRLDPAGDVAATLRTLPLDGITDLLTLRMLGYAFAELREFAAARTSLLRAQVNPLELISVILQQGDFDAALNAAQVLRIKGPAAAIQALCYAVKGDKESFSKCARSAKPVSEFVAACLASAHLVLGNAQKALECARKMKQDADGLEMQAHALYRLGQTKRALPIFEKVLAQRPAHRCYERAYALAGIACCKARLGDFQGACEAVLKAQQIYPSMAEEDIRAVLLEAVYHAGNQAQALAALDVMIEESPYPHRFQVKRAEWLKVTSRPKLKAAS